MRCVGHERATAGRTNAVGLERRWVQALGAVLGLDNDDVKTIGAAATTAGVLLALFGPAWRRWWRAPLLSVDYADKQGEPYWDHVRLGDQSFFLRLRVSNAPGCDAAEDVQVIVAAFRSELLGLDQRALEWSGQRPRKKKPVTSLHVPPGLSRHIDLIQIRPSKAGTHTVLGSTSPSNVMPQSPYEAHLCVHPTPWGGAHTVRPGDPDIRIVVTASNADAISYSMTLRYNGELSASLLAAPRREHTSVAQRVRRRLKRRTS